MTRQPRPRAAEPAADPELKKVIEHIVATTPASRLFELYYWAQEPRLLKFFRSFATLSPPNQDALLSFFELAHDGASVSARWGPRGELILAAKHVGETAAMYRYLIEDEEPAERGPKPH